MASVAQQAELAIWIGNALDYLTSEWEAIPQIAAEWDDWDELERLDFVVEWPLRVDRLRQLKRWHSEGHFSQDQHRRFRELQALIDRNRPTLERLLED